MNRKEIYQVIKGNNNDLATVLYLLEEMRYIESMMEKRKGFAWPPGVQF